MPKFPGPPIRTPFIDYSRVDPETKRPLGIPSWPWLQWFLSLYRTVAPGGTDEALYSAMDNAYPDPAAKIEDSEASSAMGGKGRDFGGEIQSGRLEGLMGGGERPTKDDRALLLSEGGILREMLDADARVLLAMVDPPRPPQTSSSLGWAVLTATTPAAPDSDFSVAHTLGRVPLGYVVVGRDMATDIYNGAGAWTNTDIILKSSIGGAAISLFVF